MFYIAESTKALGLSPWPFGIVGVIALALGLIMLIRPRRSGKVWWRLQQALQPYWRIPKWRIGWTIATGCLCLLVGVAFLWSVWALSHD